MGDLMEIIATHSSSSCSRMAFQYFSTVLKQIVSVLYSLLSHLVGLEVATFTVCDQIISNPKQEIKRMAVNNSAGVIWIL
jgi:hypothetical protein